MYMRNPIWETIHSQEWSTGLENGRKLASIDHSAQWMAFGPSILGNGYLRAVFYMGNTRASILGDEPVSRLRHVTRLGESLAATTVAASHSDAMADPAAAFAPASDMAPGNPPDAEASAATRVQKKFRQIKFDGMGQQVI
eukprot:2188559-Pleurochrysis_carterae.AAC.1